MTDEYQPRTIERIIEILLAQNDNPRSWQYEAVIHLRGCLHRQVATSDQSGAREK
jgi:hypothetical protein